MASDIWILNTSKLCILILEKDLTYYFDQFWKDRNSILIKVLCLSQHFFEDFENDYELFWALLYFML